MQVKATDHLERLQAAQAIAIRVERKHLVSWLEEIYPVILVVYDALADCAYWVHVQRELRGGKLFGLPRRGTTVTMYVPLGQVFSEDAVAEIRRFKLIAQADWRKGATHEH